jgi:hypothetical protein
VKYADPSGWETVDAVLARIIGQRVSNLIRAQDLTRKNPHYQPGAGGPFNIPSDAWCNMATYDVAEATGFDLSLLTLGISRWDVRANTASAIAGLFEPSTRLKELSPEQAQMMANEGWTVITAWFNPKGHPGHIATVRPSNEPFDPELGPLISNVGREVGEMYAKRAFSRASSLAEVKYYYDPKQTFIYDERKINRSWNYPEE